jgi:hypothetical protein
MRNPWRFDESASHCIFFSKKMLGHDTNVFTDIALRIISLRPNSVFTPTDEVRHLYRSAFDGQNLLKIGMPIDDFLLTVSRKAPSHLRLWTMRLWSGGEKGDWIPMLGESETLNSQRSWCCSPSLLKDLNDFNVRNVDHLHRLAQGTAVNIGNLAYMAHIVAKNSGDTPSRSLVNELMVIINHKHRRCCILQGDNVHTNIRTADSGALSHLDSNKHKHFAPSTKIVVPIINQPTITQIHAMDHSLHSVPGARIMAVASSPRLSGMPRNQHHLSREHPHNPESTKYLTANLSHPKCQEGMNSAAEPSGLALQSVSKSQPQSQAAHLPRKRRSPAVDKKKKYKYWRPSTTAHVSHHTEIIKSAYRDSDASVSPDKSSLPALQPTFPCHDEEALFCIFSANAPVSAFQDSLNFVEFTT